jgi:hypothetical protein
MRRSVFAFVLFALAACSSPGSTPAASAPVSAAPSATGAPLSPLVGNWELKRTCTAIVEALTRAGLRELIPQDVGETLKGVPIDAPLPARWDPSHPCAGARPPTAHSHTFWANGSFNSYDQHDAEVDAGPYRFISDNTIHLCSDSNLTCAKNDFVATLKYRIINGDMVSFTVVIPKNCSTNHCRAALAWAFAVAYPGQNWTRVTSGPNVP